MTHLVNGLSVLTPATPTPSWRHDQDVIIAPAVHHPCWGGSVDFFLQPVSLALSLVNYDSELVGSWCGKQRTLLPETVAS